MSYSRKKLLMFLACALATVFAHAAQSMRIDGVVACVNERFITVSDVMKALEPLRRQLEARGSGADIRAGLEKAYGEALESLIARHLVICEYETQERLKIPDWVADQRIDEIQERSFAGNRAALMEALAKEHMTLEAWRKEILEQIAFVSMRRAFVDERVVVPASAVRRVYEENRSKYRRVARVKLRMIWIGRGKSENEAAERKAEAEKIRVRAAAGEDFDALARNRSEDQYADKGGDWGWIEPGILREELAQVASKLPANAVSEVIETPDGYYILKVEDRQEESIRPFEEVQARIEQELRQKALEQEYEKWINQLKRRAYVKRFNSDTRE